ncbi:hypothetical protein MLD38_037642 [Melastoma candidum]|uniref:Uncharacterized protein n=1 Tax=Melastoma candidum TaxID=119954 RepID=A0ACB9LPG1_9MYRT|nr:hypothetical protein MLD38_037642 [Melastoma candidum]
MDSEGINCNRISTGTWGFDNMIKFINDIINSTRVLASEHELKSKLVGTASSPSHSHPDLIPTPTGRRHASTMTTVESPASYPGDLPAPQPFPTAVIASIAILAVLFIAFFALVLWYKFMFVGDNQGAEQPQQVADLGDLQEVMSEAPYPVTDEEEEHPPVPFSIG